MRGLIVLAVALLLGACAADYGVTTVRATLAGGELTGIEWRDGKEKARVEIVRGADGSFRYTASDVVAFDGQRVAAEIHARLAEQGVTLAGDVVAGIVTHALGAGVIAGVGRIAEGSAALEAARIKAEAAKAAAGGVP